MSTQPKETTSRWQFFYQCCPKCGKEYPRGAYSDYFVECECGEKFTVTKGRGGR